MLPDSYKEIAILLLEDVELLGDALVFSRGNGYPELLVDILELE